MSLVQKAPGFPACARRCQYGPWLAPLFIAAFDRGSPCGAAHATTSSGGQPLHPIYVLERTIGGLGNFRRLTVRWDRLMVTYGGFFHLACAHLVLRRVVK
jgi:hypothetical protein